MTFSRIVMACAGVGALAPSVRAQAALEYAARSAGTALSSTRAGLHLGVCPLDKGAVSCLHQYYPGPFWIAIVALCFLLYVLFFPKRRV